MQNVRNSHVCKRKAPPWELHATSTLQIDEHGRKTCNPARHDDRLNIHNYDILSIWRANVEFQRVLSCHVVLNYILKYASKVESKS